MNEQFFEKPIGQYEFRLSLFSSFTNASRLICWTTLIKISKKTRLPFNFYLLCTSFQSHIQTQQQHGSQLLPTFPRQRVLVRLHMQYTFLGTCCQLGSSPGCTCWYEEGPWDDQSQNDNCSHHLLLPIHEVSWLEICLWIIKQYWLSSPPNSWQRHFLRHFPTFLTFSDIFRCDINNFWRGIGNFRHDTDNFRHDTEILQPYSFDILRHFKTKLMSLQIRHGRWKETRHRRLALIILSASPRLWMTVRSLAHLPGYIP